MATLAVTGHKGSGTTTVALELARLIAVCRHQSIVNVAAFESQNSQAAMHIGARWRVKTGGGVALHLRRTKGLQPLPSFIAQCTGGVVVLDTRDALFSEEMANFGDQTQAWRDRRDLPRSADMRPGTWGVINRGLADLTYAAADLHLVDLVEVYKLSDYQRGEVEALRLRGEAQGGRLASLVVEVGGGFRSSTRGVGERAVIVRSDISGTATEADEELPPIRCAADLKEVRRRLERLVGEAVVAVLKVADEDREAWRTVLETEPAYTWDEAKEASDRASAAMIIEKIEGDLKLSGLGGRDGESEKVRLVLLRDSFGVTTVEGLAVLPLKRLEDGLLVFVDSLRERETRRRGLVKLRAILQRAGMEGRSGEAIQRRAEALAVHFRVIAEEELDTMGLEVLSEGIRSLTAAFWPEALHG